MPGGDVPLGKFTDFRRAVQATAEETVVSRCLEWPDKATGDSGLARMEQRISTAPQLKNRRMPYDGKPRIIGGFTPVVEL